jgi:catechol 2,3-dioxygenase-like lactoylglutathione lyase family enzyme
MVLMTPQRPVFEPRISIITLGVSDMKRSIRFYRDGVGFPTKAADDAGWGIFRTGGPRIALFPRELLAKDITGTDGTTRTSPPCRVLSRRPSPRPD